MRNYRDFLPAKMSCKLWLKVWTCRSFTCPFTLRNLDRNPTAALISGFIVPRAQRVCIEKGSGDDPRVCFFSPACLSELSPPLLRVPYLLRVRACCLLAFISRGRGRFVFRSSQDGSVLRNGRLLVNTGASRRWGGWSSGATLTKSSRVTFLLQSGACEMGERVFIAPPPSPQPRHRLLQQQQLANPRPPSL